MISDTLSSSLLMRKTKIRNARCANAYQRTLLLPSTATTSTAKNALRIASSSRRSVAYTYCKAPFVCSNIRTIRDPSVVVPVKPSIAEIEKALVRKKGPAKVNPDGSTQERLVIHEKTKGKNKNGIKNKAANV